MDQQVYELIDKHQYDVIVGVVSFLFFVSFACRRRRGRHDSDRSYDLLLINEAGGVGQASTAHQEQ